MTAECEENDHDWYYKNLVKDLVTLEKSEYRVCGMCGVHQHKEWRNTDGSY